jgi:catechol 2,3-dioxygenase-like lactoylglutathione lyase family enzyme
MLSKGKAHPTLPVTDIERARKFYGGTLELKLRDELAPGHLLYDAGGGTFLVVFERPTPTKADNTAASFFVDDVEATVKGLKDRGVEFEEYDIPGVTWDNGVATMGKVKGAWFKDPDGNILAVSKVA